MTDTGNILLHMLIGPGIFIAIVTALIGLSFTIGKLENFRKAHPSPLLRPLDFLPALAGLTLGWGFVAMMLAVVGGVIYPPIVSAVAEPFVCASGIEVQSQAYSYKPGQQGVSRNLLCAEPDGEPRDITLLSIAVATLAYTVAALGFSVFWLLLRRIFGKTKKRAIGSPDGTGPSG